MRYPTIYHIHLGYGNIVAGLRHTYTSTVSINSCSTISIGRVSDILRPIYAYTTVTTPINNIIKYIIKRGRVSGILIHISASYINHRHSKNFIIRNTIAIIMTGERMYGLSIPIYKTSITAHIEISCIDVFVTRAIVDSLLI